MYSAEERETIITTSDVDKEWSIYTRQQNQIKSLIKKGYEPIKVELDGEKIVSAEFLISLSKITFKKAIIKKRVLSEEEQKRRRETLEKNKRKGAMNNGTTK